MNVRFKVLVAVPALVAGTVKVVTPGPPVIVAGRRATATPSAVVLPAVPNRPVLFLRNVRLTLTNFSLISGMRAGLT